MKKLFRILLIGFVLIFKVYFIFAKNTGESLGSKPSPVFSASKDSVLNSKYLRLKKKYQNKKYTETLSQALILYDQYRNEAHPEVLYKITHLIACIYDKTNKYNYAINYYKLAFTYLSKDNNLSLDTNSEFVNNSKYVHNYLRIGSMYHYLNKKDSAIFYYKELQHFTSRSEKTLNYKAVSYSNLSDIYLKDSLFDIAKEYAKKAINIFKINGNKNNQAEAINNLGNIYLTLEEYDKAKLIYLKGIEVLKDYDGKVFLDTRSTLYYNLAWSMRNLKEYKAYDYQELSYNLQDSLRDQEVRKMIETVTAKYNVKTVKREEEIKRQKAQKTFWIIGVSAFVVILFLSFLLNLYKLRQKNLRLEISQNQLIQNQKIEKIKSDSQIRILNATIDGKESERKQIAETLHDSVSALLSSAKLHLQATKGQFKGNAPIEIDKTQFIITEASQKIRDLSHTLVSSVLLKFGLKFAIDDIVEKYSNSKLEIKTEIGSLRRYHQNFEIKTYNIIQEFINNILKHSKAGVAIIRLKEEKGMLFLEIRDNGVGFDKTKITDKDGLGINQIDARIKMMKGKFQIDSFKNKGTLIKVCLPILEKETINHV